MKKILLVSHFVYLKIKFQRDRNFLLAPKYKAGPRSKTILTDEVMDRIKFYLKEN
jgi:hypothetical protein